jgi:sulfur carrier protein
VIITVNGVEQEVTPPARLLDVLHLPPGAAVARGMAVAVDGAVVPRSQHATLELSPGSRVEIVTAVQGG